MGNKVKHRIRRIIVIAAGLVFGLALALYAGSIVAVLTGAHEDPFTYSDAVVVFGDYVAPGSQPGPEVLTRAARGVALMDDSLGGTLVLSGGRIGGGAGVGRVMAELAGISGVRGGRVFLDEESLTLEQSTTKVSQLAASQGWRQVTIVAGRLQMARARLLFSRHGMPAIAAPPVPTELTRDQDTPGRVLAEAWKYLRALMVEWA